MHKASFFVMTFVTIKTTVGFTARVSRGDFFLILGVSTVETTTMVICDGSFVMKRTEIEKILI